MAEEATYPPDVLEVLRAKFHVPQTPEAKHRAIRDYLGCTDLETREVLRDMEYGRVPRLVGIYAKAGVLQHQSPEEPPIGSKRIDQLSRDEEEEVYKRVLRRRRAKTETRKAERKQELLDRLGMSFEALHQRLQENFTRCPACKGPMMPPIFDGSIADGKFTWHTAHVTGCGMQYRLTLVRS